MILHCDGYSRSAAIFEPDTQTLRFPPSYDWADTVERLTSVRAERGNKMARTATLHEYRRQMLLGVWAVVPGLLALIVGIYLDDSGAGESEHGAALVAGYYDIAVQTVVFLSLIAARVRGWLWALSVSPILLAIVLDIVVRIWIGDNGSIWTMLTVGLAMISATVTALLAYGEAQRESAEQAGLILTLRGAGRALRIGATMLVILAFIGPWLLPIFGVRS